MNWKRHLLGLFLEKQLVSVKIRIADRQHAHRFHPRPAFLYIVHRHFLKTTQTIQLMMLEVAAHAHTTKGRAYNF